MMLETPESQTFPDGFFAGLSIESLDKQPLAAEIVDLELKELPFIKGTDRMIEIKGRIRRYADSHQETLSVWTLLQYGEGERTPIGMTGIALKKDEWEHSFSIETRTPTIPGVYRIHLVLGDLENPTHQNSTHLNVV